MTYRRLFLWLLLGSTLVLGGAWWFTLKNYTGITWSKGPGSPVLFGNMRSGQVELRWLSQSTRSKIIKGWYFDHLPPWWSVDEVLEHPLGKFYWSGKDEESPLGVPYRQYHLEFPIWVPWVLFVGGAFAACRWMERRSISGREKVLVGEVDGR